jgi:hypothetical protein
MGPHILLWSNPLVAGVLYLGIHPPHPSLSKDVVRRLRDGIATCKTSRGLSPEARVVISDLCTMARDSAWTPEQLLIAVKDACYSTPEISSLTTTSEREAMLSTIITGCIAEFYKPRGD